MKQEQLEKWEEMCSKSTPGPWISSVYGSQVLTGDSWNTVCGVRGKHNCHIEPAE
jgi:hypothetical protein